MVEGNSEWLDQLVKAVLATLLGSPAAGLASGQRVCTKRRLIGSSLEQGLQPEVGAAVPDPIDASWPAMAARLGPLMFDLYTAGPTIVSCAESGWGAVCSEPRRDLLQQTIQSEATTDLILGTLALARSLGRVAPWIQPGGAGHLRHAGAAPANNEGRWRHRAVYRDEPDNREGPLAGMVAYRLFFSLAFGGGGSSTAVEPGSGGGGDLLAVVAPAPRGGSA